MIPELMNSREPESGKTSKRRSRIFPAMIGTALFISGCASIPPTMIHEAVGPAYNVGGKRANGSLVVYSATEWTSKDDSPSMLTHSPYQIDAADGSVFDEVPNDDFDPTPVSLPKGTYTVVADSDNSGTVSVPVVIEPGKVTVLHLEGEKDWEAAGAIPAASLVRLPNGQPIGLRAPAMARPMGQLMAAARSERDSSIVEQ